tara:strand:- start:1 stop:255 length:255 start_codon:yes stop_codon:yes gene_type:complete
MTSWFDSQMSFDGKEELRVDPWDNGLYTREEFYEYYGRYLEWNLQHPEKILKRIKIDNLINSYKNKLDNECINHLLDRMIETFM